MLGKKKTPPWWMSTPSARTPSTQAPPRPQTPVGTDPPVSWLRGVIEKIGDANQVILGKIGRARVPRTKRLGRRCQSPLSFRWYWETVIMMRKLAVVVVMCFVNDPQVQTCLGVSFFFSPCPFSDVRFRGFQDVAGVRIWGFKNPMDVRKDLLHLQFSWAQVLEKMKFPQT